MLQQNAVKLELNAGKKEIKPLMWQLFLPPQESTAIWTKKFLSQLRLITGLVGSLRRLPSHL